MTDIASYSRKLSQEDVETVSIFVTKDRWRMFPPPLEEFTVVVGSETFRTCIVAEECACARTQTRVAGARLGVPPSHQHYHLEAGHFRHMLDFRPGRRVVVRSEPDGRYRVEMADEA
jgi:hypothetical protein